MKKASLPALFALALFLACAFVPAGPFPSASPGAQKHAKGHRRDSSFMRWVEYGYDSIRYQQDSLMMIDPVGDAHLIRKLDTIPIKLMSYVLYGSLPQKGLEKDELQALPDSASHDFRIGRSMPFDIDRLINKFSEIMRDDFPDIFPTMGEEHKWSPEAKRYLATGFWHRLGRHMSGKQRDFPCPILMNSKLLVCLACGWTSRFCVTGQEQALRDRIMSYPDRSIQLHDLFADSYELNKGNIYLTFLTCENVLAGTPHRTERRQDPMQKKLAYIRHDSMEVGDNYGAWYHFFGIALYGMFRPEFVSVFVADSESAGSFILEGADRQEDLINHYGAIFGRKFRKLLEDGAWWLNSGEEFRTDYQLPNASDKRKRRDRGKIDN